jgi:membrane protein DedA with SNARE-associated domain
MEIAHLIEILKPYFEHYGYILVFLGVMLECSAMLGLIIPGESILLIAAFYSAHGNLNVWWVMGLAFVGAVIGDNIGYYIGAHGGRRFMLKYGKYFFVKRQRLRLVDKYFKDHGGKTIFIARFTSFLRALAAITAGSMKMPFKQFFLYDVTGAAVWSVVITALGYFLGGNWPLLKKVLRDMGLTAFVLIVIVIITVVVVRRRTEYKRIEAEKQGIDESND